MNITFLVGNGFDISAGIDTSYNGFYNWYCSKDANTSKCIKQFKQDILEDLEKPIAQRTWADFELGLGKYTSKFSLDTVGEYLECYENAHKEMITYLEEQESQFKFSELPNKELDKVRSGLLNFYQELSPEEISVFKSLFNADTANSTKLNFISFNYTKILDKYIQAISKEPLKSGKEAIRN